MRHRISTRAARQIRAGIMMARDQWGGTRVWNNLDTSLRSHAYHRTRHADPRDKPQLPALLWNFDWRTSEAPWFGVSIFLMKQTTNPPWLWYAIDSVTFPPHTRRRDIERTALAMAKRTRALSAERDGRW